MSVRASPSRCAAASPTSPPSSAKRSNKPASCCAAHAPPAAAGVSSWLVYADGIQEHVQSARRRQAEHANAAAPTTPGGNHAPVTPARLRIDLAIARADIRRLRAERDKLLHRLRLQLGAEIEGPDRAGQIARVSDLEALLPQLLTERDARKAPKPTLPTTCP